MESKESHNDTLDLSSKSIYSLSQSGLSTYTGGVYTLVLDDNHISSFDKSLEQFTDLVQISCRRNRLTGVRWVTYLPQLVMINLQNNCINNLQGIERTHSLQWLCVAGNSIKDANILNACTSLTHLDLSDNFIKHLPKLSELKLLKTLLLHGNALKSIRRISSCLPSSLDTLTLAENSINDLNEFSSLQHLKGLKQLSVMGNTAITDVFNKCNDYRSFILFWSPHLTVLDGTPVLERERIQSWSLFSNQTYYPFKLGQHKELISYLASYQPKEQLLTNTLIEPHPPINKENLSPNKTLSLPPSLIDSTDIMGTLKALHCVQEMIAAQENILLQHSMSTAVVKQRPHPSYVAMEHPSVTRQQQGSHLLGTSSVAMEHPLVARQQEDTSSHGIGMQGSKMSRVLFQHLINEKEEEISHDSHVTSSANIKVIKTAPSDEMGVVKLPSEQTKDYTFTDGDLLESISSYYPVITTTSGGRGHSFPRRSSPSPSPSQLHNNLIHNSQTTPTKDTPTDVSFTSTTSLDNRMTTPTYETLTDTTNTIQTNSVQTTPTRSVTPINDTNIPTTPTSRRHSLQTTPTSRRHILQTTPTEYINESLPEKVNIIASTVEHQTTPTLPHTQTSPDKTQVIVTTPTKHQATPTKTETMPTKHQATPNQLYSRYIHPSETLIKQIIKIQSLIRGSLCRKRCILRHHKAAVIIQSCWRGYYARRHTPSILYTKNELYKRKLSTYVSLMFTQLQGCSEELAHQIHTTQIQDETLQSLLFEVEVLNEHRQNELKRQREKAAKIIQKHWRNYRAHKSLIRLNYKMTFTTNTNPLLSVCLSLQSQVKGLTELVNLLNRKLNRIENNHYLQDTILPPPHSLHLTHHSPTCLLIKWSPPISPIERGEDVPRVPPLIGYRIYIDGEQEGMISAVRTKAYIEGLDTAQTYRITVRALYEDDIESIDSNPVIATLSHPMTYHILDSDTSTTTNYYDYNKSQSPPVIFDDTSIGEGIKRTGQFIAERTPSLLIEESQYRGDTTTGVTTEPGPSVGLLQDEHTANVASTESSAWESSVFEPPLRLHEDLQDPISTNPHYSDTNPTIEDDSQDNLLGITATDQLQSINVPSAHYNNPIDTSHSSSNGTVVTQCNNDNETPCELDSYYDNDDNDNSSTKQQHYIEPELYLTNSDTQYNNNNEPSKEPCTPYHQHTVTEQHHRPSIDQSSSNLSTSGQPSISHSVTSTQPSISHSIDSGHSNSEEYQSHDGSRRPSIDQSHDGSRRPSIDQSYDGSRRPSIDQSYDGIRRPSIDQSVTSSIRIRYYNTNRRSSVDHSTTSRQSSIGQPYSTNRRLSLAQSYASIASSSTQPTTSSQSVTSLQQQPYSDGSYENTISTKHYSDTSLLRYYKSQSDISRQYSQYSRYEDDDDYYLKSRDSYYSQRRSLDSLVYQESSDVVARGDMYRTKSDNSLRKFQVNSRQGKGVSMAHRSSRHGDDSQR